jgi:Topoisomerase DNA binding C4 zinc finger
MGRRKGGFTDLLDLASRLPWKVSAGLAPVSFVVLHLIANAFAHAAPAGNLSDMGSVVIASKNATPMCPRCRSPMVMRTAKKGRNVGSSFWGCAQYPKCRHTVAT